MSKFNRRKLLKGVSAGAASTALLASGVSAEGKNNEQQDDDEVSLQKREYNAGVRRARGVVNPNVIELIPFGLSNEHIQYHKAKEVVSWLDREYLSHSMEVSTDFGDLTVIQRGEELVQIALALERKSVPKDLRDKLSGETGWPTGMDASVLVGPDGDARFVREADEEEAARALAGTDIDSETTTVSVGESIQNSSGSQPSTADATTPEFRAVSNKGAFSVSPKSSSKEALWSDNDTVRTQGYCENEGICCAADIAMAYPHCALGVWACTPAGPGGLACVVAFVSLCVPNGVLIGLSGCCYNVYKDCL